MDCSGTDQIQLSPALEDYLETLWNILQVSKVARVKEIAEHHGVNMASVTPALKRLQKMGLVEYSARAFVDLTPEGERLGRRIKTRHDLITRFLCEILGVSEENARADACAAEHIFSDETFDHLVRFFEFIEQCDEKDKSFLQNFLTCSRVHPEKKGQPCSRAKKRGDLPHFSKERQRYLTNLDPGSSATVLQVVAPSGHRQKLIDAGFVPGVEVCYIRTDPDGEPVWVRIGTEEISLSMDEAACVVVSEQNTESA